jgi:hypothetical protein
MLSRKEIEEELKSWRALAKRYGESMTVAETIERLETCKQLAEWLEQAYKHCLNPEPCRSQTCTDCADARYRAVRWL